MDRRVISEPAAYLRLQIGSREVQVLSPVEPERTHTPTFRERKQHLAVVALHDSSRTDVDRLIEPSPAVVAKLEERKSSVHDLHDLHPNLRARTRARHRREFAPHDAWNDNDISFGLREGPAQAGAYRVRVQPLVPLFAEICSQSLLLIARRRAKHFGELVGVCRLETRYKGGLIEHETLISGAFGKRPAAASKKQGPDVNPTAAATIEWCGSTATSLLPFARVRQSRSGFKRLDGQRGSRAGWHSME